MNGNLTKPQKKALTMIPKGLHSEESLTKKGLSKIQLVSLASKAAITRQINNGKVMYARP
tara:strand:- start:1550 stop:1729 length:180 start_codon:yes stop_codon:yes gene_type:complete